MDNTSETVTAVDTIDVMAIAQDLISRIKDTKKWKEAKRDVAKQMRYICMDEEDDFKMHMHVIKTFLRPLPTYLSGLRVFSVRDNQKCNSLKEHYCETSNADGTRTIRDRVQVLSYNDSVYAFMTNGKVVEELGLSVLVSEPPSLYVCKLSPEIFGKYFSCQLFTHCLF